MKPTMARTTSPLSPRPLLLLALLLFCGFSTAWALPQCSTSSPAHTWQCWEHSLTSTKSPAYSNPYRDVVVKVTYTGASGAASGLSYSTYAFWDGSTTFRFRTAFPKTGTWNWATTCVSSTFCGSGDSGLVGATGSISVSAYSGTNPLYSNGFLKVSPNKRYLVHDNGTPFVWMGDTAWAAPILSTDTAWQSYVTTRAAGSFSVIQVSPAPIWADSTALGNTSICQPTNANSHSPFVGTCASSNLPNNASNWSPAYWLDVDKRIQAANDAGLVVGLIGVMEPLDERPSTTMYPSSADAQIFAHNLVARYSGNFVFYSPSNDSKISVTATKTLMTDVGAAIHAYTSLMLRPQLVTNHPAAEVSLSTQQELHSQTWLDFDMIQSGQNSGTLSTDLNRAADQVTNLLGMSTPKPVVNGEGIYDNQDTGSSPFQTAYHAREVGYLSTLSGAFGYTYGALPVVDWQSTLTTAEGWASAGQMKILRTILNNHGWASLTPTPGRIGSTYSNGSQRIAFSESATAAAAYVPDAKSEVILDLSNLSCFPNAWTRRWVSPRTGLCAKSSGKCITAATTGTSTAYHFAKPSSGACDGGCDAQDWVLSLLRTSSTCPASDLGGGMASLAGSLADDTSSPTGDVSMTPIDSDYVGSPVVAYQSDGSSMVVWEKEGVDGAGNEIHARVYDNTGAPTTSDFIVSGASSGSQYHPYVAVSDLGSYAVVWARRDTDGTPLGILAQLFDSSGTAQTTEFQVNCSENDADYPQIGIPTSYYISGYGYLMVTWVSHDSSGSDYIRAQDFYGTSGTLSGSSWIVGTPDPTVLNLDQFATEESWTTTYECSF